MLNRVNTVLVTNTEANNTGTTIANIAAGDILLMNRSFTNLTGTPTIPSSVDNDLVYFVMKSPTGQVRRSAPIKISNITKVSDVTYVAPVEEIFYLGSNGTTGSITVENYTEYKLIILLKDDQRVMPERQTRTVLNYVTGANDTQATITAAFVAKVNLDPNMNRFVVASQTTDGAGNYGVQLTGLPITYNGIDLYQKVNFVASLYTGDFDATNGNLVPTTPMNMGVGYWEQIRDMEYFAQGYDGVTNRTLFPGSITNPATLAIPGNLYNYLVIEHFDEHEGDLQNQMKSPLTTVIAYSCASAPTKSTKEATMIAILQSLFGSAGVVVP